MALELLGSRVIGPVFGVTLFVWAALLVVTLASLSIGYFAGGVLIDRHPHSSMLGFAVAASGVLIVLGSLASPLVPRIAIPLGPRVGRVLAAATLYGPP